MHIHDFHIYYIAETFIRAALVYNFVPASMPGAVTVVIWLVALLLPLLTPMFLLAAPSNFLCWCSRWTCGAWAWSSTTRSSAGVFPSEIQNSSIPDSTGEACLPGLSSSRQSGAACRVTPRYCKQIKRYIQRKFYRYMRSVEDWGRNERF